jgi:hypothetical protein
MRKVVVAAAVIAASAATSACGHSRDENPGPTVSRSYQVGNFDQLEVAGPFDVKIHTGAAPSVQAKGSEKLIERLVVEVRDGKLLIHPKERHGWFGSSSSVHGKGEIAVTVPSLRAATLAGSGGIEIDKVRGDSFDGQIAGSGDLKVDSVDVGNLKLGIAGSGGARAGSGKAKSAEYEIAGSGGVDGAAITVDSLKVSIAGSGNVKARATGTADVDIMGSGDVEVTGGAKCSVSKAGSGDVRCS